MKVARFQVEGEISFGVLDAAESGEGVDVVELTNDPIVAGYDTTGRRFKLEEVRLLAPVIPRSKVVCVGKNYADHIEEMKSLTGGETPAEPLLFLKPNTSVIGPGDTIVRPAISERVEHEGELALVIGAVAKDVAEEDAMKYVFGYTCANDVSARDLQIKDGQWTRGKGFDTFCPLGPVIETDPAFADARIMTRVNGDLRQDGSTSQLIHSLARIVSYASQAFTLLPGDVILTGTPAGVGPLEAGDSVEVEIDGIGILRNPVRNAGD
ncbi:2-keto-4-pentenoate hydratase/2-oxohepta-3-ene-1,7-dioic acid hydratase in catechol pathway [Leucobacter luti]|uniref:fumarylacetoacetate hydrolase family protein n=1 Tax=Leucobacter luti TaxID=340320 RepID=UPI0010537B5B|nr:fumarylacetoacetate hydrolase family protein [Leucobacter luti]MCW2287523.1 2-keto-4-pentenoate hydratase/2-oxohepta-3-ene-1,7-dioic acid hydratase in catechol pathway [Leucobacter luti]TCK41745.1 2-keto-4-pentenoate hydratase/2-oxohepta-3-ene-1,7-dioic acid hydratase in catechol pathway [Leucobacter luti]